MASGRCAVVVFDTPRDQVTDTARRAAGRFGADMVCVIPAEHLDRAAAAAALGTTSSQILVVRPDGLILSRHVADEETRRPRGGRHGR